MNRREFLQLLAQGAALAGGAVTAAPDAAAALYDLTPFGHGRILHFTDSHGQLLPIHFREPSVNLGIGDDAGRLPHRVGRHLLEVLGDLSPRQAHAFTHLDFSAAARQFGRVGGFAQLKTLIDRLRAGAPGGSALLLDGGDTWQGSATALWTRGRDMVEAANRLGVDVMTGHWEFTYGADALRENLRTFAGDFVAHNVYATEEAQFAGTPVHDAFTGRVFPACTLREVAGRRVAVVGQAFPYTPIANPARFVPDWTFGIRERELAALIADIRERERPDALILLSHNGMDVDLKLAARVRGIDFILGGHTHDAMPCALEVDNGAGRTVVTNAGSHGKFLAVLDLAFGRGGVSDYRYRLLPVFADLLPADRGMQAWIEGLRAPYRARLEEPLACADSLLFRRGNFNGSFDQLIVDGLREQLDAQIALSPGFRWGTSVLPGEAITRERLLDQTAISYPETYLRTLRGAELRHILESVADNLFHPDPYYRQGGDMVRSGGFRYRLDPRAPMGARVSAMTLASGEAMDDRSLYKVAGWATVDAPATGEPVWAVIERYLRDRGTLSVQHLDSPALVGVRGNPGIADYPRPLM